MDASLPVTGLIEEFEALLESADFEGAEELLAGALSGPGIESGAGVSRGLEAFYHFQYGRLYSRWNKLTSAIHHLQLAAELAHVRGDELFVIQVVSELKAAKARQLGQRP